MKSNLQLMLLVMLAVCATPSRARDLPPAAAASAPAMAAPAGPTAAALPPTVFKELDQAYDRLQAFKYAHQIPLTLGAWQWWHADRGKALHYGTKDASGTFFFYLTADPTRPLTGGPVKSVGAHVEVRVNDGDKFRGFFSSRLWTYDSYLWAYTSYGTFKAGQVRKCIGRDWDDSFWGGTAYFDGFKLNPDWGVSWENTHVFDARLSLASFAQFFVHEDGINGSLGYAEPESIPGFTAKNTVVLRTVAKFKASERVQLELGLSGQVGGIASSRWDIGSQQTTACAVDLSVHYTLRKDLDLKVFGEVLQSEGAISPYRYVSGGASTRIVDTLLGLHVRHGMITYRVGRSTGRDYHPDGQQLIWIGGVTVALAKNIDCYVERVRWTVRPAFFKQDLTFNDGWELALHWRL